MNIVLAGGSGFIGRHLCQRLLEKGHHVDVLTRRNVKLPAGANAVNWDGQKSGFWHQNVALSDAVINLSGAGVADRLWTQAYRQKLITSRIESTRAIIQALQEAKIKPKVLINASAVGYYGNGGEQNLDENSKKGSGFLADLCDEWEKEARKAEALGIRVVLVRIGVVLGRDGGALAKMLLPFKLGLGGRLGDGQQWMPWIHVSDVVGIIEAALQNTNYRGIINAVSPNPVTNSDFTRALGQALHRPTLFPVPSPILKMGLGDMSRILLDSQKVMPSVAISNKHSFNYAEIGPALKNIVG